MALNAEMARLLGAEAELDALACVDLRTGAVLSWSTRDEASRRTLEVAAQAASQLCLAPPLDTRGEGDARVRETLIVSDSAVHVFALSISRPGCAFVGVARGGANVGLVMASVRSLAVGLVESEAR